MKYTQLQAFSKHLQNAAPNHFAPVYVIIGKNAFERHTAIEGLLTALFPQEQERSLAIRTMDGEQVTLGALMSELNSQHLFASRRALQILNVDKADKALTAKLESYFAKPDSTLFLIVSATALHHSSNFYKKCEKAGILLEFVEEKPWEKEKSIIPWITAQVASEGKSIGAAAAKQLVKLLGPEQSTLYNELKKLSCYVGSRKEITVQDIAAVSSSVNSENGWQLGEALLKREPAAALRIGRELLMEGNAAIGMVRQIRSQFQTAYQVCSLLAHGGSEGDITKLFPYMRGFTLERHRSLAENYGMKRFNNAMLQIDDTEWQLKSSGTDQNFLIELLIMKLTT